MTHHDFDSGADEPLRFPRRHRVRGVLVSIVLGPVMVFCAINAMLALLSQFVAGWTPSSWFSSSALDWFFAGGTDGGAANYFAFMVNGVLSSMCFAGIKWAFTGRVG